MMRYDIKKADGTEEIKAANWDGVTKCIAGQLIVDCGAHGTRVYDSFGDFLVDFPDAERFRVVNVNSGEVLSDELETLVEANEIAADIETHETQPEVEIQKFVNNEWLAKSNNWTA